MKKRSQYRPTTTTLDKINTTKDTINSTIDEEEKKKIPGILEFLENKIH